MAWRKHRCLANERGSDQNAWKRSGGFLSCGMAGTDLREVNKLLDTPELPELGPGPRRQVQPEAALNHAVEKLVGAAKLSQEKEQIVRALILLWHDHLEAAHVIAQEIENADGAFVHGIMHRREPDYGNAAYWFRRMGK